MIHYATPHLPSHATSDMQQSVATASNSNMQRQLQQHATTVNIIMIVFVIQPNGRQQRFRPLRAMFASKCKGSSSVYPWEQGSHARGVYLSQDTSRMGTARLKREEEADPNNCTVTKINIVVVAQVVVIAITISSYRLSNLITSPSLP